MKYSTPLIVYGLFTVMLLDQATVNDQCQQQDNSKQEWSKQIELRDPALLQPGLGQRRILDDSFGIDRILGHDANFRTPAQRASQLLDRPLEFLS